MKPVKPWDPKTECNLEGFADFKKELMTASYHNACEGTGEMSLARAATQRAGEIAIEHEWPLWAMQRMFNEIKPLVAWDDFLQKYINILFERQK